MSITSTATVSLVKRGVILAAVLIAATVVVESATTLLADLFAPIFPESVTDLFVDLRIYAKRTIEILGIVLAAYVGADVALSN